MPAVGVQGDKASDSQLRLERSPQSAEVLIFCTYVHDIESLLAHVQQHALLSCPGSHLHEVVSMSCNCTVSAVLAAPGHRNTALPFKGGDSSS